MPGKELNVRQDNDFVVNFFLPADALGLKIEVQIL